MRDPFASVAQPVKKLRGFKRVRLEPGETKQITFSLQQAQFAFYDVDGAWTIEPGVIELMIGASSADIRLREAVTISAGGASDRPASSIITATEVN